MPTTSRRDARSQVWNDDERARYETGIRAIIPRRFLPFNFISVEVSPLAYSIVLVQFTFSAAHIGSSPIMAIGDSYPVYVGDIFPNPKRKARQDNPRWCVKEKIGFGKSSMVFIAKNNEKNGEP